MAVSTNKSRTFAALGIITVFLSLFATRSYAQYEEEDENAPHMYIDQPRVFYGGLLIGANFSQVDGDYFAGYHKIGLNVGGIVYAQVAKHLAFSMEILYSQKGSKSSNPEYSPYNPKIAILKYGIDANYAEVPIMINYFDKRKSHFGVGVSYARLVGTNETIQIDSSNVKNTLEFNDKYPFVKDAFDVLAGVDLHLWKGLFLNVRFQYSIVPIRTELPPREYARADQFNNMWVIRLMYLLK